MSFDLNQTIRIAGVIKESIVDGPGLRYTLFTQGCTHRCNGCHNPQSHDIDGGKEITLQRVYDDILKNPLLKGVTFSGGEPFLQGEKLIDLAIALKEKNLDIIIFSGFTFEYILENIEDKNFALLKYADVLIDGKFILKEKSLMLKFRGSKNQRIIDVKKSLSLKKAILIEDLMKSDLK